jgi:hypothetical protein
MCYKLVNPVINSGIETGPSYSFTCNLQKGPKTEGALVNESYAARRSVPKPTTSAWMWMHKQGPWCK